MPQTMGEMSSVLLIGWTSGISLYLSVALAGISARMHWISLPEGLNLLTHPLIIGLAIFLYAIEFFADKIPFVDSAWDSFHTFIRPGGAAVVGFLAGTQYGPLAQTALAVATGSVALQIHATKASARLAINTSPEPFSNIAASVTEHSLVIGLYWFFIKHPVLAVMTLIALLILSFFILRLLWKFVRKVFHFIFGSKEKNIQSG